MSRCPHSATPSHPLSPFPIRSLLLIPTSSSLVPSSTSLLVSFPFNTSHPNTTTNRAGIPMPRPFGRAVPCPLACPAQRPVPGSFHGCLWAWIEVL